MSNEELDKTEAALHDFPQDVRPVVQKLIDEVRTLRSFIEQSEEEARHEAWDRDTRD